METSRTPAERYLRIPSGVVDLDGDLYVGQGARAVIVFAHGSGSNRHSPRNRYVAGVMQEAGLSTLLVSLLSVEEEAEDLITGKLRFDIGLLGKRLVSIADWLHSNRETAHLKLGLFGSSTGAAGALICAAERPQLVFAIVSRGGRPDLVPDLGRIEVPTLLIVGGNDHQVIELNKRAFSVLKNAKLEMVPGATHLFEEPGALERVAELAKDWFLTHLPGARETASP